jgi:hypothetical protein
MTTINSRTAAMNERFPDLPRQMANLPVDHRGFPVPWFVAWQDGKPMFPVADGRKMNIAVKEQLCWVCGGALPKARASVIGPMCAINRTISEPQSHLECARFSARNCPFLANPRMKRVPENLLPNDRVKPAGNGIMRNPGAVAVWIETKPTKRFNAGNGFLFQLGKPTKVEWYAHGRAATFDEVTASIESGLPLLFEAAEQESTYARRTAAREEIMRRFVAIGTLLPPPVLVSEAA